MKFWQQAALRTVLVSVALFVGFAPLSASKVTLQSPTSPSVGEPGVTNINVTGSGFPGSNIPAADVTITLNPAKPGTGPSGSTTATATKRIKGNTWQITFVIPTSIVVSVPTAYAVSVSGTDSEGEAFSSINTAALTVNPPASIASISPNSGQAGQSLSVTITGLFTNFVQGTTQASFGAGISVGGAAEGSFGPVTVSSATSAVAQLAIDASAVAGSRTVTVKTGLEQPSLSNGFTVTSAVPPPVISDFNPKSAPVGTVVNVTGSNFVPASGAGPQVTLNKQGGGSIAAPVSTFSAASISFVIPTGAASGPITVSVASQSATSASSLTIVPPSSFTLTAAPSAANVIQGQSTGYAVTLNSTNGFSQLAGLSISGLPAGLRATFAPPQITAGQTSILTVTAPATQPTGTATLTASASASVGGIPESQSASLTLTVQPVTTSFMGRTVVDDTLQTPLAGVTVTFLGKDGSGNPTGCSGPGLQTASDGAGNFAFTNLPAACVGSQLVGYDGSTATSPPGKYAGVNLAYTLVSGQVTTPPVLIRLPRIDNEETMMVQQNGPSDQTLEFKTIPGLSITVYAGTVFTEADGSQPNPFPLTGIQVPVDRLPDQMPMMPGKIMGFIVAFQPANTVANQPVAVTFPNTLNTPPGVDMDLNTLDPTKGVMVKYGTGKVSGDGMQIVPDPDPAFPGHRFGLVHFDWHGPMPPAPPGNNPGSGGGGTGGGCSCNVCCGGSDQGLSAPDTVGDPVDLASGLQLVKVTDIAVNGPRGPISITRTYRNASGNPGPFGIGTNHAYGYQLGLAPLRQQGQGIITMTMPDGSQFTFNQQPDGTFTNSVVPVLRGAVMTLQSETVLTLRWKDGTVFGFQTPPSGALTAFLSSITDANGNIISLTLNPSVAGQLTQVTDAVGRSLTLTYDSFNRVTSVVDPIGRTVQYTYNSQGTLATVTDPAGGITSYSYDSNNNLTTITDARGVTVAQNVYDANGRVTQQMRPDGGVLGASYTLLDPANPQTSPVLTATVTDPQANQSTHRFSPTGLLTDVTDPAGQTRTIGRDAQHNNIVNSIDGTGSCTVCPSARAGTQTFSLDQNGNVLSQTDALGNTTVFTYDPNFNKVTSIKDPLGNITRFTYDSSGNLLSRTDANNHTTSLAYNSFGQVTQATDALGQTTNFSYDAFGNLVTVTDPLGNTTTTTYDAVSRPVQTTDALGRKTTTTYDALDRVVSRTDAKGNTTGFTYDAVGNLLSVTDARGNATSFTYDGLNRLLTRTDPLGKTDARVYDKNGNLIQFTDRRGQTSTFTYDALNRLVTETYQDSTVTRSYDANGRLIAVNDSASGAFDFTYDAAGRLLSSSTQFGTVEYSYDAAGRVTSRQVAGQSALAYTYDPAGNLLSATLPQASAAFAYDADTRLQSITRGNGVSSSYAYDNAGRLLTLTHSGGQGINIPLTYSYDTVGNRTTQSTTVGQPLISQAVANTFDIANRLLTSGSTSDTYDANGNLASSTGPTGTTTYTWDSRNRLVSISAPGQTTTFIYDFAGNLISENQSGSVNLTQNFVLDDVTNVAYVSKSNGDNLSVLVGRSIDQHAAAVHSSGQVEYGVSDAINSTVATVDQTGKQLASFFYEPYGQTTTTASYPFQYTGRMPASGSLYYYRARYYDSIASRFTSEDPAGFFGRDEDLFRYVRNNPLTFWDPKGIQFSTVGGFTVTISDNTPNGYYQPPQPPPPNAPFQIEVSTTNIFSQNPTISLAPFGPTPAGGPSFCPYSPPPLRNPTAELLEEYRLCTANGSHCVISGGEVHEVPDIPVE